MNLIKKFIFANGGVAAIEFALSFPLLALLLFGTVDGARYVLITQKVERVAATLSDVTSQSDTITSTQLGQIITAAGQVLQPYDFAADGYAIISSVTKTGANAPVVNWQYRSTGTIQTSHIGVSGGAATMPANFTIAAGETVIVAEVFYAYKPILNGYLYNNNQIYRTSIYKPRLGSLTTLGWLSPIIQKEKLLWNS